MGGRERRRGEGRHYRDWWRCGRRQEGGRGTPVTRLIVHATGGLEMWLLCCSSLLDRLFSWGCWLSVELPVVLALLFRVLSHIRLSNILFYLARAIFVCCRSSLRCGRGFENKRPRRPEGEYDDLPVYRLFTTISFVSFTPIRVLRHLSRYSDQPCALVHLP